MKVKGLCVLVVIVILTAACNTKTTTTAVAPEKAAAPAAAPPSAWRVNAPQVNKMDRSTLQFVTTSSNFVSLDLCFENGKPCDPISVDVHPPRGCFLESNVSGYNYRRKVRVRFDAEKPRQELWIITDGHNALAPPRGRELVEQLKKHKQFMIEFGCASYDTGDVITFNVEGLDTAIAQVQRPTPAPQSKSISAASERVKTVSKSSTSKPDTLTPEQEQDIERLKKEYLQRCKDHPDVAKELGCPTQS